MSGIISILKNSQKINIHYIWFMLKKYWMNKSFEFFFFYTKKTNKSKQTKFHLFSILRARITKIGKKWK